MQITNNQVSTLILIEYFEKIVKESPDKETIEKRITEIKNKIKSSILNQLDLHLENNL
jgi:hypothetical protein